MSFVLRMAWREARASALRLLFFFLCVALGVAAIVLLRSLMQTVRTTLTREARSFIGADVVVRSTAPWTPAVLEEIDAQFARAGVTDRTEVIETQTMASAPPGKGTGVVRLVEVIAIGPGFPYYGTLGLEDGGAWSHDRLAGHGVAVPPAFLVEMGLARGDTLRLAGQDFTIRAVVVEDRLAQGGGFAFGPRVYVDVDDLRGMSLLGYGSRAAYQIVARVPEDALSGLVRRLRGRLDRRAAVRDWRTLEDRLGRNLAIGENYLSLVGFAIVVLGGIGVWSVTRVVVQQKVRSVAVLKCLGTTSGRVLGIYLLQMLWLAGGGSVLGVAVAVASAAMVPARLVEPLGIAAIHVTASAAGQGVLVGVLVSMLFALVPLLDMQRVKPLLLLRQDAVGVARAHDRRTLAAWAAAGLALVVVAVWQAGSLRAGLFVTAGLAAVALALLVAGRLLLRLTAPLTRSPRFAVRHAIVSLGRPGNQTRVILMAVGLGCFFILSVRAVQANLLHEFDAQIGGAAPDLVLIDIQADQVEGVSRTVAPYLSAPLELLPLMRARVTAVQGARIQLKDVDAVREHRQLAREFGLTYRLGLEDNERLLAGQFWSTALPPGGVEAGVDTEVSIEQDVHEEAGLELGDLVRFSVAGQPLTARVTSIRDVAWDDARNGGFVFVLRPAPAVERAAHSFVGFVGAGTDAQARGALQRDLVREFPNVSVIDVRAVLASVREVVENVTLGVTVVGAVTLAGGVLILVGAVAMTKFQRLYEAAIYRTLGASTRLLTTLVAVEYGLLGALAGVLGAAGALGLSWALARFLFHITWAPGPGMLAAGAGLTALVVCVVGVLASADVLVRKPLGTLRSE